MGRIEKPLSRFVLAASIIAMLTISLQAQPRQFEDKTIEATIQAEIIDSVMEAYRDIYVFPEVAEKMEQFVRGKYRKGEYKSITSLMDFTRQLTVDLQEISKDRHIGVRPISDEEIELLTNPPQDDNYDPLAEDKRTNFGFKKLEILPGNVGYLDLRMFADAENAGATAVAAMNFLSNTNALIFDLRQNGGGSPSMIQLISSYLFETPTHLNSFYVRKSDEMKQFWTQASVQGPRMTETPVYVLTSGYTFSGAEEFTYNLKNLERGTIIGETTGGGAHPVGGHFWANLNVQARVPFGRAVNPITGTNWEGTGIEPHIAVPADQALERAQFEALNNLLENATDQDHRFAIDWALTGLKVILGEVTFDVEQLPAYAGSYGPRKVRLEDGKLVYQREERPPFTLIPAGDDLFLLEGLEYFRIQFERDLDGRVTRLIGLYDDGHRDANERDG